MTKKPLSAIGIVMPDDFPTALYESIHSRLTPITVSAPEATYDQYKGAWNALSYRFLSCEEHNKAFIKSIKRAGNSPPSSERYIQEKELFNFFVNGLSVIESLFYGLFAIASMIDSANFPIKTKKDMRAITPEETARKFEKLFPMESISDVLKKVNGSKKFIEWKTIRNILAHRSSPRRSFYAGGPENGQAQWIHNISIDKDTTALRYKWLIKTITDIMREADIFTQTHF